MSSRLSAIGLLLALRRCRGPAPEVDASSLEADAAVDPPAAENPDALPAPYTRKRDAIAREAASDAFFGPPRCQGAGSVFCEDFENGTIDPGRWAWQAESATGKVESGRAARGQHAFHVNLANHNKNPWNYGGITTKTQYPVAKTRLYIRMFMYLDAKTPNTHTTVLSVDSTVKAPDGGDWNYLLEMDSLTNTIGGGGAFAHRRED